MSIFGYVLSSRVHTELWWILMNSIHFLCPPLFNRVDTLKSTCLKQLCEPSFFFDKARIAN